MKKLNVLFKTEFFILSTICLYWLYRALSVTVEIFLNYEENFNPFSFLACCMMFGVALGIIQTTIFRCCLIKNFSKKAQSKLSNKEKKSAISLVILNIIFFVIYLAFVAESFCFAFYIIALPLIYLLEIIIYITIKPDKQ